MNSTLSRAVLVAHEKITGRKILERMEELNRTQWLSRDALIELQREKLLRLVEYAYQNVPYYQKTFRAAGFHPEDLRKNPDCFSQVPLLNKAVVRENWDDLQTTEQIRRKGMSKLSTSGSTGQPLIFMQDSSYRDMVTADINRHLGWAGWQLGDVHAVIWGVNPNRTPRQKLRADAIDWVWNRFQIDAFHMTEENMGDFALRIRHQKPKILFGYATCIHQFARYVRDHAFKDITFHGVFTTAELLLPPVRMMIEETFRCRVFNRYGTLELGGIACECEAHTGLHTSAENNYIEILREDVPAAPGQVGDIVVTNLNNYGMPFIRYQIGDAGAWQEGGDCPCGRKSPMLQNIEGRIGEMFLARDGRTIRAAFSSGFRCLAHPSIRQFQVVQHSIDAMTMRIVPAGLVPAETLSEITAAFRKTFGDGVVVDYQFVDEIRPLPSGKHQYAVSEIAAVNIGMKSTVESNDYHI